MINKLLRLETQFSRVYSKIIDWIKSWSAQNQALYSQELLNWHF